MNEKYGAEYKISILHNKEVELIEFLLKCYDNAKQMPSRVIFENNFPDLQKRAFDGVPVIVPEDYRVYVYNFINKRVNKEISKNILKINQEIEKNGLSEDLMEQLNQMHRLSNLNKVKPIVTDLSIKNIYQDRLSRPAGMIFNIDCLDSRLGGLNFGTLTTIAGFTAHYKSVCATNLAYYNAYFNGYNVLYLSLETPKEEAYMNVLCRHSYNSFFPDYLFIPHDKIRQCLLGQDEEDYLFNVVEKDYIENSKGRLIILDESDFNTMSYGEIYAVFEQIDDMLGGNLDAFIVDYIQLLKYTGGRKDDNTVINDYVSMFRRMTQSFRDGSKRKKLIGVLLSQINRESWKKAVKRGGEYDLTCLADANELERGSHRVITTFTTEDLKASKEATIQILKNRMGMTLITPTSVFADGESYTFLDATNDFSSPTISGTDLGDLFNYPDDLNSILE